MLEIEKKSKVGLRTLGYTGKQDGLRNAFPSCYKVK